MKRKFDSISNNDQTYQPQQKRRRLDPLYILIDKMEKQENKLNQIVEKINNLNNRINNVDKRLKDVENFIEENTPKQPTFNEPPSYIY